MERSCDESEIGGLILFRITNFFMISTSPSDHALLTTRQMAEADRLTTLAGTPGTALMAEAGAAVVRAIFQRWLPCPVTVLCGPGNNGGDGFVVAQLLAQAGWPTRLALLGERMILKGDAAHHAAQWTGAIEPLSPAVLDGAALVVDALFGAGLARALQGQAALTLAAAHNANLPIVAIDVPSGVMGDTGEYLGEYQGEWLGQSLSQSSNLVPAALTVTFFRKKPGHVLLPGRFLCGPVVVADIGTPASVLANIDIATFENAPALWQSALPVLQPAGHKYHRGHALILGGYPQTGAARLAARAAARSGAGLVTVAVPELAFPIYAASLTSIMVTPLAGPNDLVQLLKDSRLSAFLIGPGYGQSAIALQNTLALLATGKPCVLDADAITAFTQQAENLAKAVVGPCVLTPHEGEFSRVFDASGDKLTRCRRAARDTGAVVVLKGADTVIAAPDGRVIVNSNAPPTLATAGAGDVLAGLICGLMAQGMPAFEAAAAGVWLHGAAAAEFGPGLMAEDLPDLLPRVLHRLLTSNRPDNP